MTHRKIRVLIVDDSALVRRILSSALSREPDLEVVGTAPDAYVARDKVLSLKPDVLTLDIEMPQVDGLTFLQKLMEHHPLPVIVVSSNGQASCHTALKALQLGAVDVMAKPSGPYSVGELQYSLAQKIRAAAGATVRRGAQAFDAPPQLSSSPTLSPARTSGAPSIIAIGASTGGTEAIHYILSRLPEGMPPIVIAQHIPAGFSRAFADRLSQMCMMPVKEAEHGDIAAPGTVLVAPGNYHMYVHRRANGYFVKLDQAEMVCYQRPAVDVLFSSVAVAAKATALGVLLTGMGSDGAQGLLEMKRAGAHTVAQSEATCVVFGMPREAIRLGAVDSVLALPHIPSHLASNGMRHATVMAQPSASL